MEKFHLLFDSTCNLLKASEEGQENLTKAALMLEKRANILENTSRHIENTIINAVSRSSQDSAEIIIGEVFSSLQEANKNANKAAKRYEDAAQFSIITWGMMLFISFLIAVALLWFFFIKEIPTIEEIQLLRVEKEAVERDLAKLKKYGN